MQKVLFVVDADSQYFGCKHLAECFNKQDWEVHFFIPENHIVPDHVLANIKYNFNVNKETWETFYNLSYLTKFHAIGVFLTGSYIARLRVAVVEIFKAQGTRPWLFTGYNGIVYEKYEEGMFWRLGYDYVCLNGPRDEGIFSAVFGGTTFSDQPRVVTGLNRRISHERKPKIESKMAVFAEQVQVPKSIAERIHLFRILRQLADHNPDWHVYVKPRVRPHERTFHRQILNPENVYYELPNNLSVTHSPMDTLLQEASLLITISSTAIFDAVQSGVPAISICDFGVKRELGTHFFVGSGIMASIENTIDLDVLAKYRPDQHWLFSVGATEAHHPISLIDTIKAAKCTGPTPAAPEKHILFPRNITNDKGRTKTFSDCIYSGRQSYWTRDFDEAVQSFSRALRIKPQSVSSLVWLAYAQLKNGQRERARQAAQEARVLLKRSRPRRRQYFRLMAFYIILATQWHLFFHR